MKRSILVCVALLGSVCFGDLYDRGGGMIYDDVLDITWMQDAGMANGDWWEVTDWANALVYAGYDDWRLPHAVGGLGYNKTDSELGYMYYVNLGNEAEEGDDVVFGNENVGPFKNVKGFYWTGTLYSDPELAWDFTFWTGRQGLSNKSTTNPDINDHRHAWAVRDGDVTPIPAPGAFFLASFGVSLSGWILRKRRPL